MKEKGREGWMEQKWRKKTDAGHMQLRLICFLVETNTGYRITACMKCYTSRTGGDP